MTGFVMTIVIAALTVGPLGRLALIHPLTPNLFIVYIWALAWFRRRDETIRWAIIGGLILDIAGFSYFGLWTVMAVAIVLAIISLKERFLDTSSLLHAILALVVVSFLSPLTYSIITRSFPYQAVLLSVLGNVLLGLIVYYLLAMQFKLFQRWAGRHLE